MKLFSYLVIALVAVAIVAGFFIVGSPQEERLRRFDEQRVQDLQTIQWQIINYWQRKATLPPTIADLTDSISGFTAPRDPETGVAYEYQTKGELVFSLCATFNRPTVAGSASATTVPVKPMPIGISPEQQNWQHDAGRACFDRTIDPQLYPPIPYPTQKPGR